MNRILKIEDIENCIEIFGNKFEVDFSENYINKLKSIDIKNINDNNVFEQLKQMLNVVLNDEEAYNKIKNSYEEQKNKEFGLQTFIKVFEFIFSEYVKEMQGLGEKKFNKPQIRNNYNNNRGYRGYRRY